MARFIPEGWTCSANTTQAFNAESSHFFRLASRVARRYYDVPAIDHDDLVQSGVMATLYALDNYRPERGNRDGFIQRCIENTYRMIAVEATAQRRHPHTWRQAEDGRWESGPDKQFTDVHTEEIEAEPARTTMDLEALQARAARRRALSSLRAQLNPNAQQVFDLRTNPSPALMAAARNYMGRKVGFEAKMPTAALAAVTGLPVAAVTRALKDIRTVTGGAL